MHHIEEAVNNGRPVLVELDSSICRTTLALHIKPNAKSTVAINQIGYRKVIWAIFMVASGYHLDGQDFKSFFK
jgi:hypothetical protein